MKKVRNKIIIILFLSSLFFSSCISKEEAIKLKYIELDSINNSFKKKMTYRDSLLFNYTMEEYIKRGYIGIFELDMIERGYKVYNITDNIYYSPDGLKCLSFEIIKTPTAAHEPNTVPEGSREYLYAANQLVGIRKDTTSMWEVYYLLQYGVNGYPTYKELRGMMQKYFFETISKEYKYNLQDPRFWTKNTIWKKGNSVPGFYDFQVNTNEYYYKRDKHKYPLDSFMVKKPEIKYPDKILKLYSR